ncbi:MAG: hypothetical protein Q9185_003427 [Variospora sp. 1 TL-2023]
MNPSFTRTTAKNNPQKLIIAFQITLDIIDGQSELQQPDWAVETGTSTLKTRDVADGPISSTLLLRTIPDTLERHHRLWAHTSLLPPSDERPRKRTRLDPRLLMDPPPPAPRLVSSRPASSAHSLRTTPNFLALETAGNDNDHTSQEEAAGSLRRGHSDGDVLGSQLRSLGGSRRANEETWMNFLRDSPRPADDADTLSRRRAIRDLAVQDPARRQERQAAIMQRAALVLADRKRRLTENHDDHNRRRSASSLPFGPPTAAHRSAFVSTPAAEPSFAGIEVVDLTDARDVDAEASQPNSRSFGSPQSPPHQIDSALGGGQEVRLCNPCVPDPNPLPHLPFEVPSRSGIQSFPRPGFDASRSPSNNSLQGVPGRSSSIRTGLNPPGRRHFDVSNVLPDNSSGAGSTDHQYTRQSGPLRHFDRLPPNYPLAYGSVPDHSVHDRYLDSIQPPSHQRHRHHASTSTIATPHYRSLSDLNAPLPPRPLPPRPQPQLREEDECPICHQALPPKGADGSEAAREGHIAECIEQHFSTSTPRSNRPHPSMATDAAVTASAAGARQSQAAGGSGTSDGSVRRESEGAGSSNDNAFQRIGSQRRRVAGMVTYSASEKDCMGEGGESAECVICFEEFEQGAEMGRLECLCKFHKTPDMSLHRVSSMSSYEHVRGSSPARSEHRKMSFNPVGTWVPPAAKKEPVGAFEVSKTRRLVQVATAVVYCLFAAGIVFGYAALKPVLLAERVYREYCPKVRTSAAETCYEQEIRLNLMFTTAAVATNVCALPVGTVLDRYGPRVCGVIGSILLTIGTLFFAFAAQLPIDGYIPGYFFLALGGPFVFISSFQLSNTFPRHSGLILALLTGAFDSSSAIFLFYRLIYNASNRTFTPQKFFLVYLVVPISICIAQLTLMPLRSYKTVGELVTHAEDPANDIRPHIDSRISDESRVARIREERRQHRESTVSEITSLLGRKGEEGDRQTAQEEERKKNISGVWGALHGRSAVQQIRSPWFILITLFTVIQMTRINYFVATIRTQYEHLLSSHAQAVHVNHVFDVALPLGGVLAIPLIGLVLDNTSTPFVLALLVSVATAIGLLGVLPYLWAAYANVALFVLYRPLYYTAVSDYAAKVFGFHTFGKVYGLIICLAGVLNFLQSALDAATHRVFDGDPVPINTVLLAVALVVGAALVGFVAWKSRVMGRERLEDEAEGGARERVMPEEQPNGGGFSVM